MARVRPEVAVGLSFLLTLGVVVNAFYHKKQFYPSVVYLTKSNSSMAVIYLQAFVFALLVGKLMNRIFFGQLRAIEMEHLFERSWYAITETCLAFTVFRDDFSPKFVTLFTLLLFLKCFHWLAEDRVEYMERSPIITLLFHLRIIGLMSLLILLDLNFVYIAYNHTIQKGASVQLVFGFEYAILFVNVFSTFVKYLLHTIDLQNENPWENKGIYMLYSDLILGFFRVVLYLTFMSLMIKIHTFPLFAIRPMYLSLRSFKKSLNDVIMSRRAIRNLNIMYPDVTPEQLRNYSDTICIICREEMSHGPNNNENSSSIKKLPCDHIFHKSCLRSWFQRQQTCPTCRTSILRLNNNHPPAQAANPPPNAQPNHAAAPGEAQVPPPQPPAAGSSGSASLNQAGNSSAAQQPFSNLNSMPFANTPGRSAFFPQSNLFNNDFGFSMPGGPANIPMHPFAFMPPPLPPLNIPSSLSHEDLLEMEGNERHNVEARIHCLRNISTLLNASMIHMQQYMNMSAATSHLENLTQTRNPATRIENDLKYLKTLKTEPSPCTSAEATNSKAEKHSELISDSNDPTTSNEAESKHGNSIDDIQENDDIRKRRLQHFQTPQQ